MSTIIYKIYNFVFFVRYYQFHIVFKRLTDVFSLLCGQKLLQKIEIVSEIGVTV